jgi:hypothetical protein
MEKYTPIFTHSFDWMLLNFIGNMMSPFLVLRNCDGMLDCEFRRKVVHAFGCAPIFCADIVLNSEEKLDAIYMVSFSLSG